jgi:EAL domain-containing protein (putative c-di-GMP-specific phosphodiesterase class I)
VVLELTEDAIVEMRGRAAPELAELHEMGVRVAIDDFGTGYSSLSYLSGIDFAVLKLDRVFLEQPDALRRIELLTAMHSLADAVSAVTVAEGVESRDQVRLLRRAGLRYAQGFLFGPPDLAGERPAEPLLDPRCIPHDD